MSTNDLDLSQDGGPNPYEIVERFWPYDGPYSDERTTAAAVMIGRLGRYLNNATQKPNGLPYAAVVGRVLNEMAGAVAGYDQLLGQLAEFLAREAEDNPSSLYDDRRDRPGVQTAWETAVLLDDARGPIRALYLALSAPARLASHLGERVMTGWNPDEWRWDADPSDSRAWDPQRWEEESWTVDGRPTRNWAAAQAPVSGHRVDRVAGPGPVLLAAAGGAVVATGLGLLVLLLGGVLVAMVLGALVLLGAGALGAAWMRGAQ